MTDLIQELLDVGIEAHTPIPVRELRAKLRLAEERRAEVIAELRVLVAEAEKDS